MFIKAFVVKFEDAAQGQVQEIDAQVVRKCGRNHPEDLITGRPDQNTDKHSAQNRQYDDGPAPDSILQSFREVTVDLPEHPLLEARRHIGTFLHNIGYILLSHKTNYKRAAPCCCYSRIFRCTASKSSSRSPRTLNTSTIWNNGAARFACTGCLTRTGIDFSTAWPTNCAA